jgi:hypothetical protein
MHRPLLLAAVSASLALGAGGAAAKGFSFVPHRAVYELSLERAEAAAKLEKVSGRIVYQMTGNACIGYSMTLRQVTRLHSGDGSATTSDLRSVTWEDGAAKSYRFRTENFLDNVPRDDADGSAERLADGGLEVRLTKPEPDTFSVRGPIVLPTEHLRLLVEAGQAGQRILEARAYDGAPDGRKVQDTLGLIGPAATASDGLEPAARVPELARTERYPVTLSYFSPGTGERTPDYVLGFDLYVNGVSRALRIDYGNFVLRGELTSIEFLNTVPCER